MNSIIVAAGLGEEFSPQFLSNPENRELVKAEIAAIQDEDARGYPFIYFPAALIAAKQWDEAEAALDFPTDVVDDFPHMHAHVIVEVATAFLAQGFKERALLLADRAVRVAEKIAVHWQKAEVLNEAASVFRATSHSQKALEIQLLAADIAAEDQDNDIDCSSVMKSITWDLARDGEFSSARDVASAIRNPVRRRSAFQFIREEEQQMWACSDENENQMRSAIEETPEKQEDMALS